MSSETFDSDNACRHIELLLEDHVDGQLTAADQRRVERHVAGCAACGDRLASLERLLRQVAALPRETAPASDLWPEIAPRLVERSPAVQRPFAGGWHRARQAVAAVALLTLGGVLGQLLQPGQGDPTPAPAIVATELSSEADFALAEADFLRAKEALWSAVYSSHDAASPETREVVERNLALIAGAIRELRAALEANPGNQQLEGLLLAQHRSEIDLLQRLARATEI